MSRDGSGRVDCDQDLIFLPQVERSLLREWRSCMGRTGLIPYSGCWVLGKRVSFHHKQPFPLLTALLREGQGHISPDRAGEEKEFSQENLLR